MAAPSHVLFVYTVVLCNEEFILFNIVKEIRRTDLKGNEQNVKRINDLAKRIDYI